MENYYIKNSTRETKKYHQITRAEKIYQITENQIIKVTKCTKHLLEFAIEGLFN